MASKRNNKKKPIKRHSKTSTGLKVLFIFLSLIVVGAGTFAIFKIVNDSSFVTVISTNNNNGNNNGGGNNGGGNNNDTPHIPIESIDPETSEINF